MGVQIDGCASWATAGWLQYLTSLDVNTSHPISKKNLSRLWHQLSQSSPKPKINIHLRGLFRLSSNSPIGTFRSMHSSICLMWLGCHYFCVLHSNLLTIPLRGGGRGGGAVKKAGSSLSSLPGDWRQHQSEEMDCAAVGSARALDCRVMSATERLTRKNVCWHIFSPCKSRIFWDH